MNYKKISTHAYNLHMIKTDKFKKTMFRINFKNKVNRKDIVYRKLINGIILESNSVYQTRRLLDIKTEDLYNLEVINYVQQSGNAIMSQFVCTFLSDKYEEGLFKQCVEYMSDIIFKPLVKDNRFDTKAFNKVKEMVKESIETYKENTTAYALSRALEEMEEGPFSYHKAGYIEDLEEVTESSLYEYYLNMLKKDTVDIFVIGNIDYGETIKAINQFFPINTIKHLKVKHPIKHTKIRNRYKKVIEDNDSNQSILILGHKLDNLTNFEKEYVLPLYSYILGGGPDSKLFKNVREKHSLCYSVSSSAYAVSNALMVIAGIDKSNARKCYRLIKKEIVNMKNGEFTDFDIEKAKMTYVNAYKEILDSKESIISNYVAMEYLGYDDIDTNIKNIQKVNKKMITKLSEKIHPDLMYLLKGDKNE